MPDTPPLPLLLVRLPDLPSGELREVQTEIHGEVESLILYREEGQVRAWLNICPHAGRALDWAPGQFLKTADGKLVCAAHGATFELEAGMCVSGPCKGQSLLAVAVTVVGDAVVLAQPGPCPLR